MWPNISHVTYLPSSHIAYHRAYQLYSYIATIWPHRYIADVWLYSYIATIWPYG